MFDDYKKNVLDYFKERQSKDELSLNLTHPTAAKLREECRILFKRHCSKKDERILRSFFELSPEQEMHEHLISRFDPEKFKPLLNFLRGGTNKTDKKNVELLAWLIAYEPRPYQPDLLYLNSAAENSEAELFAKEKIQDEPVQPPADSVPISSSITPDHLKADTKEPVNPGQKAEERQNHPLSGKAETIIKRKIPAQARSAWILVILVMACSAIYMVKKESGDDGGCMYWNGDHYERVACDEKMKDVVVFAFDSVKHAAFRRITRMDTITKNSIGVIGYLKYNNEVEFFTKKGNHPVYLQKRLKPMSAYIYETYIRKNK